MPAGVLSSCHMGRGRASAGRRPDGGKNESGGCLSCREGLWMNPAGDRRAEQDVGGRWYEDEKMAGPAGGGCIADGAAVRLLETG